MKYQGRPSISPVIAALFAGGLIRRTDRVLDVGCGTGTDALTLASYGVKDVVGLETDAAALATARRRARRLGLRPAWVEGSATQLPHHFGNGRFTVLLDTLCFGNLPRQATASYLRGAAAVLEPGGLFVFQARWAAAHFDPFGVVDAPLFPSFTRLFSFGPLVNLHLPDLRRRPGARDWAMIGLAIGRRRGRPARGPKEKRG